MPNKIIHVNKNLLRRIKEEYSHLKLSYEHHHLLKYAMFCRDGIKLVPEHLDEFVRTFGLTITPQITIDGDFTLSFNYLSSLMNANECYRREALADLSKLA